MRVEINGNGYDLDLYDIEEFINKDTYENQAAPVKDMLDTLVDEFRARLWREAVGEGSYFNQPASVNSCLDASADEFRVRLWKELTGK